MKTQNLSHALRLAFYDHDWPYESHRFEASDDLSDPPDVLFIIDKAAGLRFHVVAHDHFHGTIASYAEHVRDSWERALQGRRIFMDEGLPE